MLAVLLVLQVWHAFATIPNDDPCNALPIGTLTPGASVFFNGSNIGAENDPFFYPACVDQFNTAWYHFVLPPGYTNARITLIPITPGSFELIMVDPSACVAPPGFPYLSTAVCSSGPGLPLISENIGECLPDGGAVLFRVSGDEGLYDLVIDAVDPTCFDGCKNGFETGVDMLAPIVIGSDSGDSVLCDGDTITLFGPAGYDQFMWSTGDTTPFIKVFAPGNYSLSAFQTFSGCSSVGSINISYAPGCVWPGETDGNGMVNGRDLLPIGLAFGSFGPGRPFPSIDFFGYSAPDWPQFFAGIYDGRNYKFADASGDGFVEFFDVAAIDQNYGGFTAARGGVSESGGPGDPPLYIEFEADSFEVGDTIHATVHLGDSIDIADSLYGFGFNLKLPMMFLDSTYFLASFDTSWLDDDPTPKISFSRLVANSGYADLSYSRTDQMSRSGFGPVLTFEVVVVDNLGGKLTKVRDLGFGFDQELAVNEFADSLSLYAKSDTVVVTEFCISAGLDASSEWLNGVAFDNKKIITGNDGGYRETTITAGALETGKTYKIGMWPLFSGSSVNQQFRVWMDLNLDGDYADSNELLIDTVSKKLFRKDVTIPASTTLGWNCIRFQMKRYDGVAPQACEDFDFGEVEDLMIEVIAGSPRLADPGSGDGLSLQCYPNPASGEVWISVTGSVLEASGITDQMARHEFIGSAILQLYDISGRLVLTEKLSDHQDEQGWHQSIENSIGSIAGPGQRISLKGVEAGVYLMVLQADKVRLHQKLIIE